MRKHARILAIATVLAAGIATASALYADNSHGSSGSMMANGMMGRDGMMGSMMQMMENCGQMMQGMKDGSGRPNDQWKKTPSARVEKI